MSALCLTLESTQKPDQLQMAGFGCDTACPKSTLVLEKHPQLVSLQAPWLGGVYLSATDAALGTLFPKLRDEIQRVTPFRRMVHLHPRTVINTVDRWMAGQLAKACGDPEFSHLLVGSEPRPYVRPIRWWLGEYPFGRVASIDGFQRDPYEGDA